MKPVTEILLSAAFVLTPEEHFVQGAYALTLDGVSLSRGRANCVEAAKWCVVAAIDNAAYALGLEGSKLLLAQTVFFRAAKTLAPKSGFAEDFNNNHTHAEVLDALYKAAELAEQS